VTLRRLRSPKLCSSTVRALTGRKALALPILDACRWNQETHLDTKSGTSSTFLPSTQSHYQENQNTSMLRRHQSKETCICNSAMPESIRHCLIRRCHYRTSLSIVCLKSEVLHRGLQQDRKRETSAEVDRAPSPSHTATIGQRYQYTATELKFTCMRKNLILLSAPRPIRSCLHQHILHSIIRRFPLKLFIPKARIALPGKRFRHPTHRIPEIPHRHAHTPPLIYTRTHTVRIDTCLACCLIRIIR